MSDKALEGILSNLKELGFTEYEGKVYMALLNEHPLSAYNISKNSSVPHSRVYDITRRLIKKGYVTSKGTNPELFSPISPEELVSRLRRDNTKRTDELKLQLDSIQFTADFDPVWNLSGRTEALEMAEELIEEAENTIFVGLWDEELKVLEESFKKAEKKGIRILILLYGEGKPDFGEVYYHSVENLQDITEVGRSLDLVIDSKVCIAGSLGGVAPCQSVWTRNKGLIKSIEGFIIHDFYIAEMRDYLGDKADEVFGKKFERLRLKYGH
ncbi:MULTISPECIES: TrmB family transcriptional regulator [unclassified Oceanispirochaeta]|uniref:TrmB family transcriptional regulator n=1 Tax=unclassified Oceanispirochaeta TaxID=2635722 RepID=UPI000E08FEBD|nr:MULTISPECIES: helix-turn-helix domain-containing protein [unclassified Oceanispirochaeta]MBF9015807.1 TrmB family transcriptional regulator [Oceanispirochaeta sp. M2]NPD72270.1 TrmB family transcriptional regulator [Oceanispirochaeta sp. M1]RDG32365.1 TrmB family transcriptional regulator [Oceanispirochaeta sp. M1]